MKIAICGLLTSENLGEQFIAKSLSYLISKVYVDSKKDIKELDFVYVDINANKETITPSKNAIERRIKNCYYYKLVGIVGETIDFFLKKMAVKVNNQSAKNVLYRIRHFIWNHSINYRKRFYKYYSEKFTNVDLIVVDGAGLLEYSTNEYQEPLLLISSYGEKNNVPIIYNAIGSSGEYNVDDYRCRILMKALRSKAVKYVSARDNLPVVQDCVGENHSVKLLADAAFWCSETYDIKAIDNRKKIGIGLIRGDALLRYNINFKEQDWIVLFSNVGKLLSERGYDFFYFTNGMPADYEMGLKVIEYSGLSKDYLVERPIDERDLLTTISECAGLITCRMHSSIAAFSLGIPSVVFSWNKKVDRYMNEVGYPERVIPLSVNSAELATEALMVAMKEGIIKERILGMKKRALQSVEEYAHFFVTRKIN